MVEVGWERVFPALVSHKNFMSEISLPLPHSGPHNINPPTLGPKCEPKCCANGGGREGDTLFHNYAKAGEIAQQLKAGLTTNLGPLTYQSFF